MTDGERIDTLVAVPDADPGTLVGRTLVMAQQAADATLAEAYAEAERVRAEARAEASRLDALIESLRAEVDSLSRQLDPTNVTPPAALRQRTHLPIERQAAALVLEEFHATAVTATAVPVTPAPPVTHAPQVTQAPPVTEAAPASSTDNAVRSAIRQIPMEAIGPILAIVVVLGIMLVWLG